METPREVDSGSQKPLDDAIAEYLMACEVEGKGPRTVQAYAETLRVFRRIVTTVDLPTTLGGYAASDIYRFLMAIMDSPVSLGTRHRRFRETRVFFSWCTRMGYVPKHPFTGIPNVKVEQRVIQPFTEEEVQRLLEASDRATAFGCRNRVIILLFLDTGMRALELLRVEVDDVNWETRRIHIRHGKGRKQRVVPFGEGPRRRCATTSRDSAGRSRAVSSSPHAEPGDRWRRSRSPRCSTGWAAVPVWIMPMPIASGIRSPPGRSRTMPGSWMCSTSWATRTRRWSVATPPPTTPRKRADAHAAFSPAARLLRAPHAVR